MVKKNNRFVSIIDLVTVFIIGKLLYLTLGGGWTALDESMELFKDAGPNAGNPYSDPPPEYLALPGPVYVLLNKNDLGNRVPQV